MTLLITHKKFITIFVSDVFIPRTLLYPKYGEKHNLVLICNGIDNKIKRIAVH